MRNAIAWVAGCAAKLIALTLAVLAIPTALLALILYNFEGQLLNPDTYRRAFREAQLYEQLPRLIGAQLLHGMSYRPCVEEPQACDEEGPSEEEGGPPALFSNLSEAQLETIVRMLMPPAWLQAQTESVIGQLFAYLDSDQEQLALQVSLVAVKEKLQGESLTQFLKTLVASLPPCTAAQLEALSGANGADPLEIGLTCNPPDDVLSDISRQAEPLIETGLLSSIPDDGVVSVPFPTTLFEAGEGQVPGPLQALDLPTDPRDFLRLVLGLFRLAPAIPAGLLLLVALFGARSWKGLLRWWGFPLVFVGLIGAGLFALSNASLDGAVTDLVESRLGESPLLTRESLDVALGVLSGIMHSYLATVAVQAGVLGIIGAMLLVLSLFIRRRPAHIAQSASVGQALPAPEVGV